MWAGVIVVIIVLGGLIWRGGRRTRHREFMLHYLSRQEDKAGKNDKDGCDPPGEE